MSTLFLFLFIFTVLLMTVGLLFPSLFHIKEEYKETITRKSIALQLGILSLVLFVFTGITAEKKSANIGKSTPEVMAVMTEIPSATPTQKPTLKPTSTPLPTKRPTSPPTSIPKPSSTPRPSPKLTSTPTASQKPTATPVPPTKTPTQSPPSNTASWSCDCSKSCGQISSCPEAYYQLNTCKCSIRDRDKDGIPCEEDPLFCT